MASRFIYKPKSLCRLFSGLMSLPDVDNGTDIDDWEIIVVSDEEDNSTKEEISDIFSELGDDPSIPFHSHYLHSNIKIKYTILSKEEVFQYLQDKISRISSVFLLSTSEAAMILHHFKWNVLETENRWLMNEENVRKTVGLFKRHVTTIVSPTEHRACEICYDNSPGNNLLGVVSCGHQFCTSCWTGYISIAIWGGPSCLTLRCPGESCDAAVEWDFIKQLSSEENKKKFEQYMIESCLLGDIELKWCPAPGCECAVFLISEGDNNTVTCNCSYSFCWNCCKEVHAPVDCGTVDKWMAEITVQLENRMLANLEPLPTYNSLFSPNQTRSSSSHDCSESFSCMNWSTYRAPDRWESWADDDEIPQLSDTYDKFAIESDRAKANFQRYIPFCEGWITYESLRFKASENVKILDSYLDILSSKFDLPKKEINFIVDAQLQLVDCYQVLRWLCVYEYYMSEDEANKKNLFTILLEEAKNLVERLKKQVEELDLILGVDVSLKEFRDFKSDLVTRTRATRKYYVNMVDGLRARLPEVTSNLTSSNVEESQDKMDQYLDVVREEGENWQEQHKHKIW